MICNKCGKNNPAGADKCSNCKEPMPSLTNCGGFSDILSYNAPPAAEASPAPIPAPAPQPAPMPVRNTMEQQKNEPWYNEFLTKKNIIILSAIAVLIVVILCVFIALISGDEDSLDISNNGTATVATDDTADAEDGTPDAASGTEDAEEKVLYTIKIKKGTIDGNPVGLEIVNDKIKFSLLDSKGKTVKFHHEENSAATESFELDANKEYTISFYATADQFPMTVKDSQPDKEGKSYLLELKGNTPKWNEQIVETDDSDELVVKTGIVDVKKIDFKNGENSTIVEVWYENKVIATKNDVKASNPEIPIEVTVPAKTTEVEVVVKYTASDGEQKKSLTVKNLKEKE